MTSEVGNVRVVRFAHPWPCQFGAATAVAMGLLLIAMGGGHLYGVIADALAESKPFDYRFVSLLATGGILAYPGVLSLMVCRWLWQGRDWAYAMCIAAAAATMVYLGLLLVMHAPDPATPLRVGSELNYAAIFTGTYLLTLSAAWSFLRSERRSAA